ncbi:MAG TPA: LptF/LptG family permease, partial [bacterium]|nr:LptF/LptG family permease [bacterium]
QFITNRDGGYWILGAESSSGQTLNQVILVDHDGRGSYTIYEARQAEWNQDHWVLRNVNYLRWQPGADPPVPPLATSAAELTIDLRRTPSDILRFQRNVEELSLAELKAYIREQERQFAEDAADLEALEADPAAVPSEIAGSTRDLEKLQMEIRKNWAKYHLKISTPFACLIFALLAAPLGMNPLRATSSIGFGLSMILVFVYYFLAQSGVNFAANGLVHPAVLAWIPNAVFILYGLWLNGQFVWSSGK